MVFFPKKKLQRRSVKRTSRAVVALTGAMLILLAVRPAHAQNLVITQPTDFWFHYDDTTTFNARTYQVPNHPSDPQLWLYNSEGTLIVTNDDFYGLQSRLQIQVEPGWYRLRAGTCCYEPDVWRTNGEWNLDYELEVEGVTNSPTTTSDSSTTTTEPATTTTSIEEWQTTTSTVTPTTVPETTSLPSTSSPTSSTTTTTLPIPTTTTSTTLAPTTTEQSTTTTVNPSSLLTTTSSLTLPTSSLPSTSTTTTTVSPPVRTTTTLVSTTTTGATTTVVTAPTSTVTFVATSTTTTIPTTADTPEEAVAIFESTSDPVAVDAAITQIAENIDTLTTEQLDEIAAVVSKAPKAVKEKFESEINIFGGGLDNYTPVGSTVNVGERRTLVVIGAVLTAMPVIAPKRK